MVVLLLSYITAFAKCVFHRIAADEFFNGDKICIFLEMKTGKKKEKNNQPSVNPACYGFYCSASSSFHHRWHHHQCYYYVQ